MVLVASNLTVGICAFNEAANLGYLLDNLLNQQDLPAGAEILVVCSGCTDGSDLIVKGFQSKDPRVKLYNEKVRAGKAAALNIILGNARGNDIILLSADVLPSPRALQNLVARMDGRRVAIVCGKPVPVNKETTALTGVIRLFWRFRDRAFSYLNHAGLLMHAGEIFCVKRGIVDSIPTNIVNDDAFIAIVSKKKGWYVVYEPSAKVFIRGPSTILDYFLQRRRIIFGHYQIRKVTGSFPQYFTALALLRPRVTARILLSELATSKSVKVFFLVLFLEFLVNIAGLLDFLLGRSHQPWRVSRSTKAWTMKPR